MQHVQINFTKQNGMKCYGQLIKCQTYQFFLILLWYWKYRTCGYNLSCIYKCAAWSGILSSSLQYTFTVLI